MLEGCLFKTRDPGINLVQICMKGRIGPRILSARVDLLLGRSMLDKVMGFLLQHECYDLDENTS
jgi:hypothetical protein